MQKAVVCNDQTQYKAASGDTKTVYQKAAKSLPKVKAHSPISE
ncbi:hypothetical protein CCACVL1_30398 [Corchorus capsularis]|uniref:Uncharacterized protein n=1 Tax=Corchorus capsularis TaxID=210143 RepID=A0A1R3FXC7_COCAP|nr:hypothetical protein CCACVL1_30398 [Corchorus capsularis]